MEAVQGRVAGNMTRLISGMAIVMSKALWLSVVGGAVVGGVMLFSAFTATAAPTQAAGAAMAGACGILPYVVARAWDELCRELYRTLQSGD